MKELVTWIEKMNLGSKPSSEIVALNFGIFESEKRYMIYLTGAKQYDPVDSNWACEIDFEPSSNKYFVLPQELSAKENWQGVLKLIETALKEFVYSDKFKDSILYGKIITTGFDEGDLIRIR